jgi:hypothetical protein
MSYVKSSGPATAVNSASQGSVSHQGQQGAGVGGQAIGLGAFNAAVGGNGLNTQHASQDTLQYMDQAASALSANCATDNIESNTTLNFGGNTAVV